MSSHLPHFFFESDLYSATSSPPDAYTGAQPLYRTHTPATFASRIVFPTHSDTPTNDVHRLTVIFRYSTTANSVRRSVQLDSDVGIVGEYIVMGGLMGGKWTTNT